jgi:hypothetical protein
MAEHQAHLKTLSDAELRRRITQCYADFSTLLPEVSKEWLAALETEMTRRMKLHLAPTAPSRSGYSRAEPPIIEIP